MDRFDILIPILLSGHLPFTVDSFSGEQIMVLLRGFYPFGIMIKTQNHTVEVRVQLQQFQHCVFRKAAECHITVAFPIL